MYVMGVHGGIIGLSAALFADDSLEAPTIS